MWHARNGGNISKLAHYVLKLSNIFCNSVDVFVFFCNVWQFGEGKACELVTAALRNFPRDHEVQIEACGAVANLANNIKENRIRLGW